jgi:dipeptidyl aminopeptidase/acylaminoacyl peptidase
MKHARRWIAIGLAALFVVGAVAYAGLSHLAFERLTTAAPRCEDRFSDYTPASFGTRGISGEFTAGGFDTAAFAMPGYREVTFSSRDERLPAGALRAWWVPAATSNAPAVIVVHGWNSCRHDPVVLLPAGMLARNGFSVLMIDLRDHGDSYVEDGRSAWGTEEYLDVLGAWDWLRATQGLAAGRIGIAGESLGAASSMIAMAEEPSVAAVWADSGFADLGVLFGEKIGENGFPGWLAPGAMLWDWILAGDDLGSRNPLAAVERIGARPLAVVHGLADTSIPVHHATDLAAVHARFVPGFEAWLVPRAPHLQASFAEAGEYERRIVAFFRASLGA